MSLAEDILTPYEQRREPYKLTEWQERLHAVLGHLKSRRTNVMNAITYLAELLESLDRDIAMVESIKQR